MIGERGEIRDPDHVFEGAGTKESRQTTENRGLRLYLGFKWRNKAQIMPQPHNSSPLFLAHIIFLGLNI